MFGSVISGLKGTMQRRDERVRVNNSKVKDSNHSLYSKTKCDFPKPNPKELQQLKLKIKQDLQQKRKKTFLLSLVITLIIGSLCIFVLTY